MAGREISLREMKKLNDEDRMWFVRYWANYVKTHPDKEWSRQQNIIINSQLQSARSVRLSPKDYLEIKKAGKKTFSL